MNTGSMSKNMAAKIQPLWQIGPILRIGKSGISISVLAASRRVGGVGVLAQKGRGQKFSDAPLQFFYVKRLLQECYALKRPVRLTGHKQCLDIGALDEE